jgi:hypothetical protein
MVVVVVVVVVWVGLVQLFASTGRNRIQAAAAAAAPPTHCASCNIQQHTGAYQQHQSATHPPEG